MQTILMEWAGINSAVFISLTFDNDFLLERCDCPEFHPVLADKSPVLYYNLYSIWVFMPLKIGHKIYFKFSNQAYSKYQSVLIIGQE